MPFLRSYDDPEGEYAMDAREQFARLAPLVVPDPLSTRLLRMRTAAGKERWLIVDRAAQAREGDLVLVERGAGYRVARLRADTPRGSVWGAVAWFLEQG